MIRFRGVETVCGYARGPVFAAGMVRANWPTAVGVRIGPEAEVLIDGGRVSAALDLPGRVLAVAGQVTRFEPGSRVEASGTQSGIFAVTAVSVADNAGDAADGGDGGEVRTTVTWEFQARLPFWLAVFELPATVAIGLAIPVLRERFVGNIIRYLEDGRSAGRPVGPAAGGLPGPTRPGVGRRQDVGAGAGPTG